MGVPDPFNHGAQLAMFIALTTLLGSARLLGELARFVHQPAVLGEIVSGILLGKTVLGRIWPYAVNALFGKGSAGFIAVRGVAMLAVTLFMLVAGIEMSLRDVVKRRKQAISVGAAGVLVPFGSGMLLTYFAFDKFDPPENVKRINFALVIGVAMSITALPVVAKTLRDMHLYRTDMGATIMAAATIDDLLGWSLFAVTLSISGGSEGGPSLPVSLVCSVLFVVLMLTVGRWLFDRMLPPLQAYLTWPGGVLGFIGFSGLASASFALYIGLHNTLGAFMTGAALGDSKHLRHKTRNMLDMFVCYIMVPIYFASVALNIDFVNNFDPLIVFSILIVSCAGKLIGAFVGAKISKLSNRECLAIAICMNCRGAVEIILANVALEYKLISNKMFVALVFMAIFTSMLPGPLLKLLIGSQNPVPFTAYLGPRSFVPILTAVTAEAAIDELCTKAGMERYSCNVFEAEMTHASGRDNRTALPNASVTGLSAPVVALGISRDGIDFQSPNSLTAQVIVLLLTPSSDVDANHDVQEDINYFLSSHEFVEEVQLAKSITEVFALVQVKRGERPPVLPM